jgi:hypothetical protein
VLTVKPAVANPLSFTVTLPYCPAVTPLAARVVENEPVPEPVIAPVKVIVWSPVLVPELEPLKFEPEIKPEAATLEGVIAPSTKVIAGVVVDVATVPLMPFAVVTETEVTVPLSAFRTPEVIESPVPSESTLAVPAAPEPP